MFNTISKTINNPTEKINSAKSGVDKSAAVCTVKICSTGSPCIIS